MSRGDAPAEGRTEEERPSAAAGAELPPLDAGPPPEPPPPGASAEEATPPATDAPEGLEPEVVAPEAGAPRRSRRRAALLCLLAWLLPGCGHLALRNWVRGPAFALLVAGSAAVGVALDGRLYWFGYGVSAPSAGPMATPENPVLVLLASLVSLALGAPTIALRWLAGYQGVVTAPGYEYGTAFLVTAGLMNLLLVLDTWDRAR